MRKFDMISISMARKLAMDDDYIVIDLRSRSEYEQGHIKYAVNIPNGEVNTIIRNVPKDKIYIFYCRRGSRSFSVAGEMAERGYRSMAVVGGYR